MRQRVTGVCGTAQTRAEEQRLESGSCQMVDEVDVSEMLERSLDVHKWMGRH